MNIYLAKQNERHGPFSIEQVGEMVRKGEFTMSDLAWREGMAEWIPIHKIGELVTVVLPPMPATPPDLVPHSMPPQISKGNQTLDGTPALSSTDPSAPQVQPPPSGHISPLKAFLACWLGFYLLTGLCGFSYSLATAVMAGVVVCLGFGIVFISNLFSQSDDKALPAKPTSIELDKSKTTESYEYLEFFNWEVKVKRRDLRWLAVFALFLLWCFLLGTGQFSRNILGRLMMVFLRHH